MNYDVIITGEDEVCLMKRDPRGIYRIVAVVIGDGEFINPSLEERADKAREIRDSMNA